MPASCRLLTGECLDVLATLEPDSVDACVTDPPYGISFMGREWDTFAPATVEKMRTPKAFGFDEDNPNLRGRTGWAGSAAVAYDRSAAASLKFQAWTQQWAEAVWRVLKPGAHAVVCASSRRPAASSWTRLLARAPPGWPASRSSAAFSALSAKRRTSPLPTRAFAPSMCASRPAGRSWRRPCWTRRTRA